MSAGPAPVAATKTVLFPSGLVTAGPSEITESPPTLLPGATTAAELWPARARTSPGWRIKGLVPEARSGTLSHKKLAVTGEGNCHPADNRGAGVLPEASL